MNQFRTICEHYDFTPRDEELLRSVYPLIQSNVDDIIRRLVASIRGLGDPVINELLEEYPRLTEHHREWLLMLFSGPYDDDYYFKLSRVGKVHAAKGIRSHYVNVSMNKVRSMLIDMFSSEIDDRSRRTELKAALNKLVDINLDIITSSYIEEEIQHYSAAQKVKTWLVTFAERFSGAMNMVLVFSLILITLGVVGLFFYDLWSLVGGNISKGILSALGSLLILWVLIELMNAEIAHLKGGKFNISVFIGVALVAFIRDLMIATLKHENVGTAYYLVATILVLGFVYWLVKWSENRSVRNL